MKENLQYSPFYFWLFKTLNCHQKNFSFCYAYREYRILKVQQKINGPDVAAYLRQDRNIKRGQCCLRFQHIRPQKRSPGVMYLTHAQQRRAGQAQSFTKWIELQGGEITACSTPHSKCCAAGTLHPWNPILKTTLCSKWPVFTKTQPKMHVDHTIWFILFIYFLMIVLKKHR